MWAEDGRMSHAQSTNVDGHHGLLSSQLRPDQAMLAPTVSQANTASQTSADSVSTSTTAPAGPLKHGPGPAIPYTQQGLPLLDSKV